MEALKDFLWPIVLVGGLGALIDFLIGKAGQERAKDFLLKWWVRFDDPATSSRIEKSPLIPSLLDSGSAA
jgi:hypothetical protein